MINIFILTYAIIAMWVFASILETHPYTKSRSLFKTQILGALHALGMSCIWPVYFIVMIYDKLSGRENEIK
jgi:hypothetical protein